MADRDTTLEFLLEVFRRADGKGSVLIDGLAAASALFLPGDACIASKRTAIEKCELRGWVRVEPDKKHVKLTVRGINRARQEGAASTIPHTPAIDLASITATR